MPSSTHNALQACIDLGSNSFHLLIAQWTPERIEIIERCSERVQLGEGVRASGAISPAAFERGLDCLKRFDELLGRYPVAR
ncbi:MAG: exopolyphosphatase, partial [OM182 bacterium]|nr:exopolyphosphatase [OM182 bacterium]